MSGHSKWSTIKRQKGANDAKRGQAFTKAGKLITIAARAGGGNPDSNFKLRLAIEAARALNMPKENIERAIARGIGSLDSGPLEEVVYEGYGPCGVALLIDAVTDNRLRTGSEIRSLLDKGGGHLAGPGSVGYNFKTIGAVTVKTDSKDPDELFLLAAEIGADDIENSMAESTVYCKPENLVKVKDGLTSEGYLVTSAEVIKESTNTIKVTDESQAKSVLKLIETLEDLDDVQKVYSNFDINLEIMEKVI